MKYRNSQTDISLKKWFQNDYDHAHLRSIEVRAGSIRGLTQFQIALDYPITAIAGKNGSGKSTLLAIACCAFHNTKSGFKIQNRKQTYYTFADFFISHKNDGPTKKIEIAYQIAFNNWRVTPANPHKKTIGTQVRYKSEGGKWNQYDSRVNRDVVFIGIERIVPHSEKSQSRSYCRYFSAGEPKGWEDELCGIVGSILGKKYEEFQIAHHSKYRLPLAKVGDVTYSGFNMGAGENALFEIFSTIFSAPTGSLIVIDEIELGLHVEAQARFIRKLKELCLKRKNQIICTTHSSEIFNHLPEEARYFIERDNNKTRATAGYSSQYAFSKLSSENSKELVILVEDDVAQKLITLNLPNEIRSRVNTEVIGSASAVSIQLASAYKLSDSRKTIALFDGDQRVRKSENSLHSQNTMEIKDESYKDWFNSKSFYLPGNTWPEAWVIEKCKESIEALSKTTKTPPSTLSEIIEYGLEAGKHNEFYEIGRHLNLPKDEVLSMFCSHISQHHPEEIEPLIKQIQSELDN